MVGGGSRGALVVGRRTVSGVDDGYCGVGMLIFQGMVPVFWNVLYEQDMA